MPYRFATERQDYADLASGKVFYGLSGTPTFPIRLASEMLQRSMAILSAEGMPGPYALYDPCCGSGYLLSTLGWLFWDQVATLTGSDVDDRALSLAEANLALLTTEGMARRIGQIKEMLEAYGKGSHQDALASAERLEKQLRERLGSHRIATALFHADVMDHLALAKGLHGRTIDIVLTDIPYGQHATWQGAAQTAPDPTWHMLDALRRVVGPPAVVAIASNKVQIAHDGYQRADRFRLGKRQVVILRPRDIGGDV